MRRLRRSAAASTSASVGASSIGRERLHRLARGDRDAARRAAPAPSRRSTHVLPTSVPVPATTTTSCAGRVLRERVAEHLGERREESVDLLVGVRRARARPAAATCPAGRSAAGSRARATPVLEQRGGGVERTLLLAADERHDRRRVAGPQPVDVRAQPRDERVALGRPHDPQRGERGGGVGGRRRGREDVRPGAVLDELDVARAGRRRTRRARRASSTACRRAARRRRRDASTVGPSTACASSSTSSAPCRAHSSTSASTSATSPSIENTVSVTTSARRGAAVAQQRVEVVEVAVAVDGDVGAREPAAVDDRRVVELVGAHEHVRGRRRW